MNEIVSDDDVVVANEDSCAIVYLMHHIIYFVELNNQTLFLVSPLEFLSVVRGDQRAARARCEAPTQAALARRVLERHRVEDELVLTRGCAAGLLERIKACLHRQAVGRGAADAQELGAEQLPTLGGDVGQSLLQGLGEVGGQLGSGTTPGDLTASAVQEGYSGLAQQAAQPGAWDALQAIGSWAGKNPELVLGGGYGISQLVPPEDEPPWWEGGGEGGYEGEASWADRERQYYGGDMGSYGPEFDYFT